MERLSQPRAAEDRRGAGPADQPPKAPEECSDPECFGRRRPALAKRGLNGRRGRAQWTERRSGIEWKAEEPIIVWKAQLNPK